MSLAPPGRARPDLRLLPAGLVCWPAAWWATGARTSTVAAAGAAGCGLALVVSVWSPLAGPRRELRAHLLLALAALVTVLTSTGVTLAVRGAGPFPAWAAQRAVVQVTGRIAGDPQPVAAGRWDAAQQRVAVRLTVSAVAARGQHRRVDVPVLVIGAGDWATVPVGGLVRADGRLSPAAPGEDVVALFSPLEPPRLIEGPAWWWRAAARVRAGLREAVQGLPPAPAGLLPSLVLGDTSTLTPQVESDLRASGLTHLTAVSGANVAIVVGSVIAVAAWCGLRLRGRVIAAGVGLVGFVVLARPEPSVLRAAVMGCVALAGLIGSRRGRGMPALAASVIVLLVADPWLGRSPGFALSVGATGGLVLLGPPWASRLQRVLPRPLALAVAVPAAAQAACSPITVLLTPSLSTVAVPANLLAEPAVLPATVLGVLAALLSQIWPWAAHLVAALGSLATWWITEVAAAGAATPGAVQPWWPGVTGALILAGATAVLVVLSLRVRPAAPAPATPRRPQRQHPVARAGAWAERLRARPALLALSSALLLAVAVVLVLRSTSGPAASADWSVAMCDVGQGDALVLRTGAQRALVVDVGPEPEAVDGCLTALGVRSIDLIVLSHFHADHVLGLPGALHGREVGAVVTGALAHPRQNVTAVQGWVKAASLTTTEVVQETAGDLGADGWQVHWSVLAPEPAPPVNGDVDDGDVDESGDGTVVNEASLVLLADLRTPAGAQLRLAALGDLELEGQSRLAARLALRGEAPVDVVKVAHHGSAKQDGALYRQLAPRVALIGVGAGNDYGHPARSALALLAAQQITVLRTDRDHLVSLSAAAGAEPGWQPRLTITRGRSDRGPPE